MSPLECYQSIHTEYLKLKDRADRGEINESAIYSLIESQARLAASHNGQPSYWREYMPIELEGIFS